MTPEEFDGLPRAEAVAALERVCTAPRWAAEVADARPFGNLPSLIDIATAALTLADLDAGMAGHPRIGDRTAAGHSAGEQGGVGDHVLDALAAGNRAYEERFGHVYLVCAAGRSGEDLLATLHARMANDPETEQNFALGELAAINRLRLEKMISA